MTAIELFFIDNIQVALTIAFYSQLEEHGATEKLKAVYGQYLISCDNQRIILQFTVSTLPEEHAKLARDVSRLKRNCFAAVFEKYFEAQVNVSFLNGSLSDFETHFKANEKQVKRAVIHYREGESIYVEAKSDRVTVIFSTTFKEKDDIIIGGVFLQEFKEGRRASATAPQVNATLSFIVLKYLYCTKFLLSQDFPK